MLVVLAIVDVAASTVALGFLRAARVLRAQRLFRMLCRSSIPQLRAAAQNIKSLSGVLIASLPGFGNVMAVIGLVLFIYAYTGVILFGKLAWNPEDLFDAGVAVPPPFRAFATPSPLPVAPASERQQPAVPPLDASPQSRLSAASPHLVPALNLTALARTNLQQEAGSPRPHSALPSSGRGGSSSPSVSLPQRPASSLATAVATPLEGEPPEPLASREQEHQQQGKEEPAGTSVLDGLLTDLRMTPEGGAGSPPEDSRPIGMSWELLQAGLRDLELHSEGSPSQAPIRHQSSSDCGGSAFKSKRSGSLLDSQMFPAAEDEEPSKAPSKSSPLDRSQSAPSGLLDEASSAAEPAEPVGQAPGAEDSSSRRRARRAGVIPIQGAPPNPAMPLTRLYTHPCLEPHTRTASDLQSLHLAPFFHSSCQPLCCAGTGKSLWLFREDNPWRLEVYAFVAHPYFEYAMFVIIFLSCIAMMIEGPWNSHVLEQALHYSDIGFTALFSLEVCIKVFAFSFRAYIKQPNNQLDFAIVVVSILSLILEAVLSSSSAMQGLRALRAIKPLRMLSRSAGMRMVLHSIFKSLAAMGESRG